MGTQSGFSAEVRQRAVRLVLAHRHEHGSRRAAIRSVAGSIGCTAETLRMWVRRAPGRPPATTPSRRPSLVSATPR